MIMSFYIDHLKHSVSLIRGGQTDYIWITGCPQYKVTALIKSLTAKPSATCFAKAVS